ncbi:hypothetical protein IFM89_020422 [Coptis chinensis]|uniref:Cytochrome P450 n=1 Tax=Coptis chinensis TaxID=261450 RepID=A0A835HMF9_9MAGN|nr:hypothetical protein IFM89_020422 [Coptis chinensis]
MEWTLASNTFLSGICLAIAFLLLAGIMKKFSVYSRQLPPGPAGWPVIGNLFDVGAMPHHSFASLSKKYGPVLWLQLGAVNTMVISSAEAAMEMFKNHDLDFANRTTNEAMRVNGFEQGSISQSEYGPYWRMVRRICTTGLFVNSRVKGTTNIRANCMDNMTKWIWDEAQEKGSVEVGRFVSLMSFNAISNVILSKDVVVDPKAQVGSEFVSSVTRLIQWISKPNVADFFPFFQWFDPQRIKKNIKPIIEHTVGFASGFVEERVLDRQTGKINAKKDFLDAMLDFQGTQKDGEPTMLSQGNITKLTLELFLASIDTTSSTIEWAMAELLHNPNTMRNVEAELDQIVGQGNKVEESDIEKLPYLQAVVKETLRLHPPLALLIPRKAREDTKFMGYSIPKDTLVFVNVWAIGRDPVSWDDPLSFMPERFLNSNIDYKGQHFQFMPFGAGRRMCAGQMLGHRMLHLALGYLAHTFKWSLDNGLTPEKMDMSEEFGITLRKADRLKAKVSKKF